MFKIQLVCWCAGLKGGALASAIHVYATHGDPYIRDLVKRTLEAVNRPIMSMLTRWIYEGELDDPNGEFFVDEDHSVPQELFWRVLSFRTLT